MASKDKKRKLAASVPAVPDSGRIDERVSTSTVAVAEPPTHPVDSKDSKKLKAARPAPVLTKKPSRLRFFVDAYQELRKAHWPSRREAVRLSLLVAAVCFVVGAVLGGIDFVFLKLMGLLLLNG